MTPLEPGAAKVAFEADPGDLVLLPFPPVLHGLAASVDLDGMRPVGVAHGDFGPQQALVVEVEGAQATATYTWRRANAAQSTDWLWSPPNSSLNRASLDLRRQIGRITAGLPHEQIEAAIIGHVAQVFRYGHGEGRFTDALDAVPLVCGLTRGSCVDIHTYAVAALRVAGLRAAYIAGVFWPESEMVASDMHCWIATEAEGPAAWDVSHDLIAGRAPSADFRACPGHRLPFSVGRGQRFQWEGEDIEISHFALPHLLKNGVALEMRAVITRLE